MSFESNLSDAPDALQPAADAAESQAVPAAPPPARSRRPHRSRSSSPQRPRTPRTGAPRSGPQHLYRPHRQDQFVQLGPVTLAPTQGKSRLPLIIGLVLALLVLAGAGVLGYAQFVA